MIIRCQKMTMMSVVSCIAASLAASTRRSTYLHALARARWDRLDLALDDRGRLVEMSREVTVVNMYTIVINIIELISTTSSFHEVEINVNVNVRLRLFQGYFPMSSRRR